MRGSPTGTQAVHALVHLPKRVPGELNSYRTRVPIYPSPLLGTFEPVKNGSPIHIAHKSVFRLNHQGRSQRCDVGPIAI